jgi:hypothetical protein
MVCHVRSRRRRGPLLPVALLLAGLSGLLPAGRAQGSPGALPYVEVTSAAMVGAHVLSIGIATGGWDSRDGGPATVALSVGLDGLPLRAALPLRRVPPRFTVDVDLAAGAIRVGGVAVAAFPPLARFEENLRFPVDVTVRQGSLWRQGRREATVLLPTVVVPGYLNEVSGVDQDFLRGLERAGYVGTGPGRTVFWFPYPSRALTVEQGARALARYVRTVVLPSTYAAKVNVVGYSVGGLLARWNVAYDIDGWGALVNRLVLVGVPNEGAVLAYLAGRAPSFLPFAGLGRSPVVRDLEPTFPFWRPAPGAPWTVPPGGGNPLLSRLNLMPVPPRVRLYVFYGDHDPRDPSGPRTMAGLTGSLPNPTLSFGPGDGVVLAASAEGLPIHGGPAVASFAHHPVARVSLGSTYHLNLLAAGAGRIAQALLDRFRTPVEEGVPEAGVPLGRSGTGDGDTAVPGRWLPP